MRQELDFFTLDPGSELNLPLVDEGIFAGFPSPAEGEMEPGIDLNKELVKHPDTTFLARVVGDSMEDANIYEGDIVVVDRSLELSHNDVAVCCINGEFNIKFVEITEDSLFLVSTNPKYPKIKVDPADDFTVWGVVTYVIHRPNNRR
ncbi:MAG: translesion error-prone DNA polymerase V autoproteolytic subunit [Porphyromonas sp.]|nr:translesion error-prone DNA polymerase V autoproteolytic subunit [Porphyromonas sp.]